MRVVYALIMHRPMHCSSDASWTYVPLIRAILLKINRSTAVHSSLLLLGSVSCPPTKGRAVVSDRRSSTEIGHRLLPAAQNTLRASRYPRAGFRRSGLYHIVQNGNLTHGRPADGR